MTNDALLVQIFAAVLELLTGVPVDSANLRSACERLVWYDSALDLVEILTLSYVL